MKMKNILLLVCLLSLSGTMLAQEKQFDIALNLGVYSTPKFKKAQTGRNYSADFDYHFKNGWTIGSGFNFGHFRYFESTLSNEPNSSLYQDGTNARITDQQVSVKLKKDLLKDGDFSLRVGTGITILTETKSYPFANKYGQGSLSHEESTFTDLAFPISVEPHYRISSWLSLGLKAEMYIEPDFPLMGFNIGPQLRVKL
jgi:hypothetical protein